MSCQLADEAAGKVSDAIEVEGEAGVIDSIDAGAAASQMNPSGGTRARKWPFTPPGQQA
jgi:hypothetical protein